MSNSGRFFKLLFNTIMYINLLVLTFITAQLQTKDKQKKYVIIGDELNKLPAKCNYPRIKY